MEAKRRANAAISENSGPNYGEIVAARRLASTKGKLAGPAHISIVGYGRASSLTRIPSDRDNYSQVVKISAGIGAGAVPVTTVSKTNVRVPPFTIQPLSAAFLKRNLLGSDCGMAM